MSYGRTHYLTIQQGWEMLYPLTGRAVAMYNEFIAKHIECPIVDDQVLREVIERGAVISAINRAIWLRDYYYTVDDDEQLQIVHRLVDTYGEVWQRREQVCNSVPV